MALPPRRLAPVAGVNPDAGSFLVTAEPAELAAVREAGEATLARYPYLRARYGERADRFTAGDGAWIVALCDRGPSGMVEQIDWLADVLLQRGMPRRMLETYLAALAAALERAWPERAEEYRRLAAEGERLAADRRLVLADADLEAVEAAFAAAAPAPAPFEPRGVGDLVASAVADAARGHAAAEPKLLGWLADRARFGEPWAAAVEAAAARARAALLAPTPPSVE